MKKKVYLTLACLTVLTGCNGTKKVDRFKFAKNLASFSPETIPTIKKEKFSGWIKLDGKESFYFTRIPSILNMTGETKGFGMDMYRHIYSYRSITPSAVLNTMGGKYYVGNGYRISDGKTTYSWDKYLNLTHVKIPNECNITIKITYNI